MSKSRPFMLEYVMLCDVGGGWVPANRTKCPQVCAICTSYMTCPAVAILSYIYACKTPGKIGLVFVLQLRYEDCVKTLQ